MKKIAKISAAAIVIIALICIIFFSVSYAKEKDFEKEKTEISVCTAEKRIALKASPWVLGAPKGYVPEKSQIKVVILGDEWSKIVAFTDKKVKSGYVKTEKLGSLTEEKILISSMEFESYNITVNIDEQLELAPMLTPIYANEAISYASSDSNVVTVENGIIKGITKGSAVITVKTENIVKELNIAVVNSPADMKFSANTVYMDKGATENLLNQISCESKDNYDFKFISSDNDVIEIKNGKASAVSEGEATITAESGTKTAQCQIIVRSIAGNSAAELKMPNAYGNQIDYHPSVQYFENKWNGYSYWCAFTPYEKCNDFWENPHILASNDLVNWETPAGFSNPLEPVPSDYEYGISYNSDTELVYNSDKNQLECWWRYYDYRNMTVCLCRKITSDGIHWSEKERTMVSTPLNKHDFLSPAIVYENHTYKMWAIDLKQRYAIHYYESADGINWTDPKIINIEYENPSLISWHLDVIHTPKGYEMLLSAFPRETHDHLHMSLYYSFSKDNETYSTARLMLKPRTGTGKWDNQGLYRSSLLYANNKYYCFYSGINSKTGPVGIGMVSGDNPFHMN